MPDGCHTALNRGLPPPPYFQVVKRRFNDLFFEPSNRTLYAQRQNYEIPLQRQDYEIPLGAAVNTPLLLLVFFAICTGAPLVCRICMRWRRGRQRDSFIIERRPALHYSEEDSGWVQHAEHVGHDWHSGLRKRVAANITSTDTLKPAKLARNTYLVHSDIGEEVSSDDDRSMKDSDDEGPRLELLSRLDGLRKRR